MPGTRQQLFIVNERQRYWWHAAEADHRASQATPVVKPVLTRPQRLDASHGNRLALRLRMIIRPSAG